MNAALPPLSAHMPQTTTYDPTFGYKPGSAPHRLKNPARIRHYLRCMPTHHLRSVSSLARRLQPGLLFILLALVGCEDYVFTTVCGHGPEHLDSHIEVEPLALVFKASSKDVETPPGPTVRSVGRDTLYLKQLFVTGSTRFTVDADNVDRILAPGESTTVPILVDHAMVDDSLAALHVVSNDSDTREVFVLLYAAPND